jgi:hypothetical protein
MIRRLRRRHLRLIAALTIALPPLVAFALSSRAPMPMTVSSAAEPGGLTLSLGPQVARVQLSSSRESPSRLIATVQFTQRSRDPDPLIYWSPVLPSPPDSLPDTARLLGAPGPRGLPLPVEALDADGYLVFFSQGHSRVIGAAPLPTQRAR